MSRPLGFSLTLTLTALAALPGCAPECESCGPSPDLAFLSPESLSLLAIGTTEIELNLEVAELILDPGDVAVEGRGKVALALDARPDPTSGVVSAEPSLSFELPGDLAPGPHRILGQLVQGDGTPFGNPESAAHAVFFVEDLDPARPQIAFVEPRPFLEHDIGEPLEVHVGVRNFEIVGNDVDCHVPEDCDPFDPEIECLSGPECEGLPISTNGHVKIFLVDDYPACLFDAPVGCNYDYVLALRPESGPVTEITGTIDPEQFPGVGTVTMTAALSYNNHAPYPNQQFIIFDQITIELVEP